MLVMISLQNMLFDLKDVNTLIKHNIISLKIVVLSHSNIEKA